MFKLPVKANLKIELNIESPIGNGQILIEAPVDVDGDGKAEEIRIRVDMPGRLLDFDEHIKITPSSFGGPILAMAAEALENSTLSGAADVAAVLRGIVPGD